MTYPSVYRRTAAWRGQPGSDRLVRGQASSELMQLAIAVLALIFALPLMILIALAIFSQDQGPVIFSHRRLGVGGRVYRCFKFRSMRVGAESGLARILADDAAAAAEWARDHKLRQDCRVTPLGAILRASSLDELPQLFNVLRGEMNLVGPRPIVWAEVPKYGRYFDAYCTVKPGITGLWQVSGRSDCSYRRRVALDVLYVRKRSLALDLALLLRTIPAVLCRRGSY